MATFELDSSFRRRRRGAAGDNRRRLAEVLGETATKAPPPAAGVFTAGDPPAAAAPSAAGSEWATCAADTPPSPPPGDPTSAAPEAVDPAAPLCLGDQELATLLAGATAAAGAAAEASAEARLADAETTLTEALIGAEAARERARRDDAGLILALVRAVARHVVGRAIAAAPLDDLDAELTALLARLEEPERVTITVAPALAGALEERLTGLAAEAGFAGTLTVEAEATLAAGDALVRWPAGEAVRRGDDRIEAALRLCADWLAERGSEPPPPAAAPTPTTEASDEH